jgi:hypothetical protein
LIDHLEQALARPPTFVRRTGWEAWGRSHCHLAEVAIERACVNYSHGYRVVVSDPVPPSPSASAAEGDPTPAATADNRRWIVLTDFNPALLSSPTALVDDGQVDNHSWTLHEFPTVVAPGDVFRRPVESCLARRTRVLAGEDGKGLPCEAVMIDEERLIVCSAATEVGPALRPRRLALAICPGADCCLAAFSDRATDVPYHGDVSLGSGPEDAFASLECVLCAFKRPRRRRLSGKTRPPPPPSRATCCACPPAEPKLSAHPVARSRDASGSFPSPPLTSRHPTSKPGSLSSSQ